MNGVCIRVFESFHFFFLALFYVLSRSLCIQFLLNISLLVYDDDPLQSVFFFSWAKYNPQRVPASGWHL